MSRNDDHSTVTLPVPAVTEGGGPLVVSGLGRHRARPAQRCFRRRRGTRRKWWPFDCEPGARMPMSALSWNQSRHEGFEDKQISVASSLAVTSRMTDSEVSQAVPDASAIEPEGPPSVRAVAEATVGGRRGGLLSSTWGKRASWQPATSAIRGKAVEMGAFGTLLRVGMGQTRRGVRNRTRSS